MDSRIIRTEVYYVLFCDLHGSASDNLVVVSFVKLAMYISITTYVAFIAKVE